MSIVNKMKSLSDKASKTVANEYQKQQKKIADKKEEKRLVEVAEKARQQKISDGDFSPITSTINLHDNEIAYFEISANRMAMVDQVVQETVGTSKKKHGITRAVVGGALLGPVGAIAGATTAGSKNNSVTTQKTISNIQIVDSGQIILTNKRFIFLGNANIISLPYKEIIASGFNDNAGTIKYIGMLSGEYYSFTGPQSADTKLYFHGITQTDKHLIIDKV